MKRDGATKCNKYMPQATTTYFEGRTTYLVLRHFNLTPTLTALVSVACIKGQTIVYYVYGFFIEIENKGRVKFDVNVI